MKKVRALSDFELACSGGLMALVADVFWLLHDILAHGLTLWYLSVGTGLCFGIAITIVGWIRHLREKRRIRAELLKSSHKKCHGDSTLDYWLDH